jgi:hypothetical protein
MAMKKMWLLCLISMIVNCVVASERPKKEMEHIDSKSYGYKEVGLWEALHKQDQKETQQRGNSKRAEKLVFNQVNSHQESERK